MRCRTKALRPARNSSTNRLDGGRHEFVAGRSVFKKTHARRLPEVFKSLAMSRAVENAASVEIHAKETRADFAREAWKKLRKKTLRFYHIYHSADGGLISHSSLLFFFSISSWTYYKATRWPSG